MASDDKESFIETTFDFTDYNQTLDFNYTNFEHSLCHLEHFESLVRICEVSWKIAFFKLLTPCTISDEFLWMPSEARSNFVLAPNFKKLIVGAAML